MLRYFVLQKLVGLILLICTSTILVTGQNNAMGPQDLKTIRMRGDIVGAADQRMVVVSRDYGGPSEDLVLDTIQLKNGYFDFLLQPEESIGFYALFFEDNPKKNFLFIATQGDEIDYQGDLEYFQFSQISGSVQDSIFRSLQIMRADYVTRINYYADSARDAEDPAQRTYYNGLNNHVFAQYSDAIIQFTLDHPGAYGPLILFKNHVFNRVGKDSSAVIYEMVSSDVKTTLLGRRTEELIRLFPDQSSLEGMAFPWIDLLDMNNKAFERNNQNGKTLVVLWASWCGPCRQEIPQLKEIFSKEIPGLSLVSISLDTQNLAWTIAMEQEQMPWDQYWAPNGFHSKLAYSLGVRSIPQLFLLDEDDKIINQWQHISEFDDKID